MKPVVTQFIGNEQNQQQGTRNAERQPKDVDD